MDIAFPNLGIYLRNVPKTIMIGNFGIALYGILIAAAMLMGITVAAKIAKKTGQDPDLYWDSFVWIVISAIAGARIYYVIFMWDYYKDNPIEIFNLRGGGLAIYGGIILSVITIFIFCRKKISNNNGHIKMIPKAETMISNALFIVVGLSSFRYNNTIDTIIDSYP